MKKIIVLTILFCGIVSAYSQEESLYERYDKKIEENGKLKDALKTEKHKFSELSTNCENDKNQLKNDKEDLMKERDDLLQQVSDLNKNKIKEERDNLQTKVESLEDRISKKDKKIKEKTEQINNEKLNSIKTADNAKKAGIEEALVNFVNYYKTPNFDDLIKSSTKESVARDIELLDNDSEVKDVLNNLKIYFNAKELLSKKFDAVQIKNAQTQLSQITRPSESRDVLKEDVESYEDFNKELKKTMGRLVDLDNREVAGTVSQIKKMKFNKIVVILSDYMYDYSDYFKYPYLSDIMLEIVNRKRPNPDSSITDLLQKL